MKITQSQLRQIIKEELEAVIQEVYPQVDAPKGISTAFYGHGAGYAGRDLRLAVEDELRRRKLSDEAFGSLSPRQQTDVLVAAVKAGGEGVQDEWREATAKPGGLMKLVYKTGLLSSDEEGAMGGGRYSARASRGLKGLKQRLDRMQSVSEEKLEKALNEADGKGCADTDKGCIRKREGGWVILNNKKGGVWRKCDSHDHCEEILDAFHASKG